MKKRVSVFVAMVFLVCQITSVGTYGDHDEGTMGSPTSISLALTMGLESA